MTVNVQKARISREFDARYLSVEKHQIFTVVGNLINLKKTS